MIRPALSTLIGLLIGALLLIGVVFAISIHEAFADRLQQTEEPFFFSPYYGTSGVNSWFDHAYPTYSACPNGNAYNTCGGLRNLKVMKYDATEWPNCGYVGQPGTLCYDGHDGTDFNVRWQPVLSVAAGDVTFANWYNTDHTVGLGLYVEMDHRNGYKTQYGHLSAIVGQQDGAIAGSVELGTGGTTGNSTGPHLHFGVLRDDTVVDPYGWHPANPATTDPWETYSGASSVDLWAGGEQTGHPIQWPETDALVLVDDDRDGVNADDDFIIGCNTGLGTESCANWHEDNSNGYGGTLMYTHPGVSADNWAEWHPALTVAGSYDVQAFVPGVHATTAVNYEVHYSGGTATVLVDQAKVTGQWIYLGTYPFAAGSGGYVRVTDATGTANSGLDIAADAVRFQHRVAEVSTSQLKGRFFRNPANSGIFQATPADTPVFAQDFPTINFNPPAGSVPCSNPTGVNVNTRPFTDVVPQPDGFCLTIPAQGNDYQAGVGELDAFQAVFLGTFTVSGPMRVTFNFYSDDGWILAVGPNPAGQKPSYVSGPRTNVPEAGPFTDLPVVGAYNQPSAPARNDLIVDFPGTGDYPFELDYSECCSGALVLTLKANGQVISAGGSIAGVVYANDPEHPLDGALVEACRTDASYCQVSKAQASGYYSIVGLPPGDYRLKAQPPAGANLVSGTLGPVTITGSEGHPDQNITLYTPLLPPPNAVSPVRTNGSGSPAVFWQDILTLTATGCAGGTAEFEISFDEDGYVRQGTMSETPSGSGTYVGSTGPLYPHHGAAHALYTIQCPGGTIQPLVFDMYVDPSGIVKSTTGWPIPGATVTLSRSEYASGPFSVVPQGDAIMSPSNRRNPDTTDAGGRFGWDVMAGYYVVRAEAGACVSPSDPEQAYIETDVLPIPPPITDLQLILDCPEVYLPLVFK